MQLKILITTEWFDPTINGVVISVENLRKGLQQLGHEVRILTVSASKRSFKKDGVTYISSVNFERIYPGARLALTSLRINRNIQDLVRWKPDIIHSQSEFSTFYFARYIAAQADIPIVHTYHTVYEDYTHYFIPNKRLGKSFVSRFTRQVLDKAQCVIVPTEKVKALLLGYGVISEIKVVPTGIDMDGVPAMLDPAEKVKLRESLLIPQENKVLVAVGRLAKEKNLEEVMLFMSKLQRSDLTLLVVGGGPRRAHLQDYSSELGISDSVIFTGMIKHKDISHYYQIGDVFVSASSSETQGLTTIEALSNGIPALCRKDAYLDNVIKNGVNGWQYESFEDFKEELLGILDKEGLYKISPNYESDHALYGNSFLVFAKMVESIYLNTANLYKKK